MQSMEEMMKAAQEAAQKIQEQMTDAQAKLEQIEVEGVAGGGLVKIKCTAKGRIIGVTIDESLMKPEEKQMVEDLVAAAFNDARQKADTASAAEMERIQGGMGLPPGFKMPGMG
jgi:nucleoid-associated protein EbfC